MDISLSPALTVIIERHLATGEYDSPEEVVSAALQRLDDSDTTLEAALDAENNRRWQNFQQTGCSIPHATIGDWVSQLPFGSNETDKHFCHVYTAKH